MDQNGFFERYRSVNPFLINEDPVTEKERIQFPEQRKVFDDPTNCILCSACFSACPALSENPDFLGPAAVSGLIRISQTDRRLPTIPWSLYLE